MDIFPIYHRGYVVRFNTSTPPPFYGKIVGISDLITVQAESLPDCLRQARDAVDDYLSTCAEMGVEPNPPRAPKE